MASFIIIPPKLVPNFNSMIKRKGLNKEALPEYLETFTLIFLNHSKKEGIYPKRGDVVKFIDYEDITIVHRDNYWKFKYYVGMLTLIFNGCLLENIFRYFAIPTTYQFPEFPIRYWEGIFNVPLIWFDYRPYRKTIIKNLTVDIPKEFVIKKNEEADFYSWILIGLDVKIHFIINGADIDYVIKIFSDEKSCAIYQHDNNCCEQPRVNTYFRKYCGSINRYVQADNIIFFDF
jgi:signal peptidase I